MFNHTTEHVYNMYAVVRNLCDLSNDIVILAVPFKQDVPYDEGSFLDFWRPPQLTLEKTFLKNGFIIMSCSKNKSPVYSVYLFCIASPYPERWQGCLKHLNRERPIIIW